MDSPNIKNTYGPGDIIEDQGGTQYQITQREKNEAYVKYYKGPREESIIAGWINVESAMYLNKRHVPHWKKVGEIQKELPQVN